MACTSITFSEPSCSGEIKDVCKEYNGRHYPLSSPSFRHRVTVQRSYPHNQLCYSTNSISANSTESRLKRANHLDIFKSKLPSLTIPSYLRSTLFEGEPSDENSSKEGYSMEKEMGGDMIMEEKDMDSDERLMENNVVEKVKKMNWVGRLIQIRDQWKAKGKNESSREVIDESKHNNCFEVSDSLEDKEDEIYNKGSFSELLAPVAWQEVKQFSQLAFLCNKAYKIREIKAQDLRKSYGFDFVTSSIKKKAEAAAININFDQDSKGITRNLSTAENGSEEAITENMTPQIHSSVAYEIAASAATYAQSCGARDMRPNSTESTSNGVGDQTSDKREGTHELCKPEIAAQVAASTMTAVVAAGEKEKEEATKVLKALHSSHCEWFICDESTKYTRCFVIQGSESLEPWQTNLLFEPTKFDGTEVLIHRGIYEAAKGICEFFSGIIDHLNKYGDFARASVHGSFSWG